MRYRTVGGCIVAFLVVCGAVSTGQPAEVRRPTADFIQRLKAADANHDGVLTKDELPERIQARFSRLDANGDGKIDQKELARLAQRFQPPRGQQAQPGRPAAEVMLQRLKAADKNGDGKITEDEVPEPFKRRFAAVDANGDGAIDQAELKALAQRLRAQATQGLAAVVARLRQADKNGDGKITEDEVPENLRNRFAALDSNKDGVLDAAELRAAVQRWRAQALRPGGGLVARLRAADKDGDGKLTKDEAPEFLKRRFDRFDANGDGFIDEEELKKMAAGRSQR